MSIKQSSAPRSKTRFNNSTAAPLQPEPLAEVVAPPIPAPTPLPSPFCDIIRYESLDSYVEGIRRNLEISSVSDVNQAILLALSGRYTNTPNTNTRIYMPLPGWSAISRDDDGKLTAVKHTETGFLANPSMVCFIYNRIGGLTPCRVKIGTSYVFFPQVCIDEEGFVNSAYRRNKLVENDNDELDTSISNVIKVLVKYASQDNTESIDKVAQTGLNLLTITNIAGLDTFNALFDDETAELSDKMANYLDTLEAGDNVRAPLVSTLMAYVIGSLSEGQKYEMIQRVKVHVTNARSLKVLISSLNLHLPIKPEVIGKYRLEEQKEIVKVKPSDLTDEHHVILGSVVSTGDSVIAFLNKPPTEIFVMTNPDSLLCFKKREGDTKERIVGTIASIDCTLLPGSILKSFLSVPKTQKSESKKRAREELPIAFTEF